MAKVDEVGLRALIRQGILDKEASNFLLGAAYSSDTEKIKELVNLLLDEGKRTYNMTDQVKMLLLMRTVVGVEDISRKTLMADILPSSLLQDTLETRLMMIEKTGIEKDKERDVVRKIEAAYISKELAGAREIARENAQLKKELEETKKKLEQFNDDVILKTRDVITRIFSSTSTNIRKLAEEEARKIN
jgi:hypothetical protein